MAVRRFWLMVACFVAMPAQAERVVFEGSFSTYGECGITGRHECSEPATVDVPFVFTVDLPSGVVNRNAAVDLSSTYAPPSLTPSMVTDGIVISATTFAGLADRERGVTTSYSTLPVGSGLRFDYDQRQFWMGTQDTGGGIVLGTYAQERVSLSLFGDLGRPGTQQPPSFSELVRLFDNAMAAHTAISVEAGALIVVAEVGNPTGAFEASKTLGGTFRVIAVQCRTPGLMARVRGALGG